MQVVILCGGQGTRIRDVSENVIPKPMVPVGDRPIVWHIMKMYAVHGYTDFVLCLGTLGWKLKEYFLNRQAMESDLTVTLGRKARVEYHDEHPEEGWRVTLVDTGSDTGTGGRVKKAASKITGDRFMLTYGDGLSDVDLGELERFHVEHGRLLTLTGVFPPGRFGELSHDGGWVTSMREKPMASDRYINGGFMVMERAFIDKYLAGADDSTMLERAPFVAAAEGGDMMMYRHQGFWQCMDTPRDWELLNRLWKSGEAAWRTW